MTRPRSPWIARLRADFLGYDRFQLSWLAGCRNAVGIGLPLLVGILSGHTSVALGVAVGALVTGFAGMAGTWQNRSRIMLAAGVWATIAAYVGIAAGTSLGWLMMLTGLSGAIAGLLVAVSPEIASVGTMGTISLVVFSGLQIPASDSGVVAIEVLVGGLLQLALMLAMVPWQPPYDGTTSLRQVLVHLAAFTVHPTRAQDLTTARALVVAETRVGDHAIREAQRRVLLMRLYHIDGVRNNVVGLYGLSRASASSSAPDQWEPLFLAVAEVLMALSDAWGPTKRNQAPGRLTHALSQLAALPGRLPDWDRAADNYWRQLRGALEALSQEPVPIGAAAMATRRRAGNWRDTGSTILHNPAVIRHALRLALVLVLAVWLERQLGLPRGYWVPLTVVVVLKPDFFSTIGRGMARMVGTLLGVVVGTAFVLMAGSHSPWGLVEVVGFAVLMYAVLNFNYTLFSVVVSAEIVVLLSVFERMPPGLVMQDRLLATVLGSVLGMGAYLLFPTWKSREVPSELAKVLEAERQYLQRIRSEGPTLAIRRETRLLRTHAAGTVEAALSEPGGHRRYGHHVQQVMTAVNQIADALMGLEQQLLIGGLGYEAAFGGFLDSIGQHLAELSDAIAKGHPAVGFSLPSPPATGDEHLRLLADRLSQAVVSLAAALPLVETA